MELFKIKKIYTTCRNCNSRKLDNIFSIKNLPMPEGHVEKNEIEYCNDINIYFCRDCYLVQTQEDLDLDEYYKSYVYTTGNSSYVNDYMHLTVEKLIKGNYIIEGDSVLEIGSGDGAQLKHFSDCGMNCIGVEPSAPLVDVARENNIETIEAMFDNRIVKHLKRLKGSFKLVIIQYTFDHLSDPVDFLENVKMLLNNDGLLLIEVHDFEKIYERNEACLFTHEHSIYPSKDSITNMLELNGFKVLKYDFIDEEYRRGNSMVILASIISSSYPKKDLKLINNLKIMRNVKSYINFSLKVEIAHKKLHKYINDRNNNGKIVAGYGAAGRGVDTCVIAGITKNDLIAVYDKNPFFENKEMPVSRIPVKKPDTLFKDNPDELIVFSYGYIDEIKTYYSNYDGKIISMLDIMNSK